MHSSEFAHEQETDTTSVQCKPSQLSCLSGIQTLLIGLCVLLIVCTGGIIGTLAISTWDSLLQQARQTGSESVETCLTSGERDIRMLGGRYLDQVITSVSAGLQLHLETPRLAVEELAELIEASPPTESVTPQSIGTLMRRAMRAKAQVLRSLGSAQILLLPQLINGTTGARVGPSLSFTEADASMGYLAAEAERPIMLTESKSPYLPSYGGDLTDNPHFLWFGESDRLGEMKHPNEACAARSYSADEKVGPCRIQMVHLMTTTMKELLGRHGDNCFSPDAPLNDPSTVHYTPLFPTFGELKMYVAKTAVHVDQTNYSPRQNNRVATILTAIDGKTISQIFSDADLPEGSLLYGIQKDHWWGGTGSVIGFNKGRIFDMANTSNAGLGDLRDSKAIHITEHTMVQGSGVPSTIAEHGAFVFANYVNNYTSYIEVVKEHNFHSWTSSNGTEYWAVIELIQRGEMKWFITLLVPRESVMDAIDASTNAIKVKVQNDRDSADEEQERALVLMLSVTFGAVSVLLVLVCIFTTLIVRPLQTLMSDMENVAIMNLEAVDQYKTQSSIREVGNMETSFKQMVRNLVEYRNYMPQSLLAVGTMESETDQQSQKGSLATDKSIQGTSSAGSGEHTIATSIARKHTMLTGEAILRRKSISVVYFNVKDWHGTTRMMSDIDTIDVHSKLLSGLLSCLQGSKGVADVVSGDRMMGTFNAFVPISSHKKQCLSVALSARKRMETLFANSAHPLTVSTSCASGDARVGHMGCVSLKKVTIMSSVLPWVVALERYSRRKGYSITADHAFREVATEFVLKGVDAIWFRKRCEKHVIRVYEVVAEAVHADEEWMYQMESAGKKNPFAVWNKVLDAIYEEDWNAGEELFRKVSIDIDPV